MDNTFFIDFSPSDKARKIFFLSGKVLPNSFRIEVDPSLLSKSQLETLSFILPVPTEGQVLKLDYKIVVDGIELTDILRGIEVEIQRQKQENEMKIQQLEDERKERVEKARKFINGGQLNGINVEFPNTGIDDLDKAVIKEAALRKEIEAAKRQEAEKEQAEKGQNLKKWALENGSDFLKDLIAEDFNWFERARKEWIEANTPPLFFDVCQNENYKESFWIKNPDPEDIEVLKRTRLLYGNARLLRVKTKCNKHENYVSINLFPPAGDSVSVEKYIRDYEAKVC